MFQPIIVKFSRVCVLASLALLTSAQALASPPEIEAYEQPDLTAEMDLALTRSGADILGDHIDIASGSLSFRHVDVSLPGNSALPVRFARSYTIDGINYARTDAVSQLGGWNIDIPFIAARVRDTANDSGWQNNRCTGTIRPQIHVDLEYNETLWGGARLFSGEGGGQLILETPTAGANVYGSTLPDKVTADHWRIDCGPTLTNGPGEGFEATSPQGWTYTFDNLFVTEQQIVVTGASECNDPFCPEPDPFESSHILPTVYWVIRASEITDAHGNWVRFEYDSNNWLTRIHANDGREITIGYDAYGQVTTVTANGRVWTYSYSGAWPVLDRVTLPDSTYWEFSLPERTTFVAGYDCSDSPPTAPTVRDTHTVRHPNGVVGTFDLGIVRHGRNNVPSVLDPYRADNDQAYVNWDTRTIGFKICNDYRVRPQNNSMAVLAKTLAMPSGQSHTWDFWYEQDNGFVDYPNGLASRDLKKRIVTDPLGQQTAYFYNRRYGSQIENQLVRTEQLDGTTVVQSTELAYAVSAGLGKSTVPLSRWVPDNYFTRENSRVLNLDGATYTTTTTYDLGFTSPDYSYGLPTNVSSSSTLQSGSRFIDAEYDHDLGDWIIGLTTRIVQNGTEMATQGYTGRGQRLWTNRFGVRVADFNYNADGTLAWHEDALGRRTSFSSYKRGRPQLITYADGSTVSAAIDDNGWMSSVTNAGGTTIGYGYNTVGWLTLVDRPTGFDDTVISYSNLGAGTTQTVTHGALRTITEHDGFHQPTRVQRQAILNGGGSIFTRYEYDALGRTTFASFPATTSNPTTGTTTTYDRLGRVTRVEENVAPFAATVTAYLTSNRTQVTDPSGNVTTTWASGWGGPGDGETIRIDHPLGLTTQMTHDAWGNMLTARQHGTHSGFSVDETQSWTYDTQQRVCRHVTPETRATQYTYDAAGQMLTVARGMGLTAACGTAGASSTTVHGYDLLGRLTSVNYPDASPDVAMSYDANGNLQTATRGISSWTYQYDAMDQLIEEELVVDGRTYETRYAYESDGRFRSTRTPVARLVYALPDGHGRARGARWNGYNYASSATYHPSGQLATMQLGNGLSYSATFNSRHQMMDLIVAGGGTTAVDFSYNYDANGRVTTITDHATTGQNRAFTYDTLGRLDTASGPWGAGSYTYDLLNNIRSKTLGLDSVDIEYNTNNQISRARDSRDGFIWRTYTHDARGNVIDNDRLSFTYDRSDQPVAMGGAVSASYAYDAHNRRVKQTINGETIYTVYSVSGSILHRDNITTGETTEYLRLGLGGRTVARIVNDGTSVQTIYSHADHLGSASAASDDAGNLLWRESYSPFGETLNNPAGNTDNEGFTGHIQDTATGLTYMQARYYDPVIGRFLSNDPVGFAEGGWQYFNRYSYTANDPINMVDLDGKCFGPMAIPCFGLAIRGIVGALARNAAGTAVVGAGLSLSSDTPSVGGSAAEPVQSMPEPTINPLPGETQQEFTQRVTDMCTEACTDWAVEEFSSGRASEINGNLFQCRARCLQRNLFESDDDSSSTDEPTDTGEPDIDDRRPND